MLDEAGSQFRRGEPGIGWERLEELRIAREAYAAAEAAMSAEALATAQTQADALMREHWQIEDGALVYRGKGFDNLCTVKD